MLSDILPHGNVWHGCRSYEMRFRLALCIHADAELFTPLRIKCKQRTNRMFIINSISANFIEHPCTPHSQRHNTVRYLSTSGGHARQPHVAVRKPSLLSCHYILNKAWTLIQKYNTIMTKICLLESNGRDKNRTRPDRCSKQIIVN